MRLGLGADVTLLATANPSSVQKLVETADAHADRLIRDLHDGTLDRDLDLEPPHPERDRAAPLRATRPARSGSTTRGTGAAASSCPPTSGRTSR